MTVDPLDRVARAGTEIVAVPATSGTAGRAVRAYLRDVATRYHGRPVTADELDRAVADHPSDDLVPPHGVFLVAMAGDEVRGCVGLARVTGTIGEVRRLHVVPGARRRGLGRALMSEVEHRGRRMGLAELRLDTRDDLVESHQLYESLGYRATPPHSGGPYSDRWYGKSLPSEPRPS